MESVAAHPSLESGMHMDKGGVSPIETAKCTYHPSTKCFS